MTESPVEKALSIVNSKWKFLIIHELVNGPKRFTQLQQAMKSITNKVLTTNLRSLEAHGLIRRKQYSDVRPKVVYSLTILGYSIQPAIDYLYEWGEAYINKN